MLSVETLNVGFIHYISLLMELEYIATVFKCYLKFIITEKGMRNSGHMNISLLCIKSKLLEVFLSMICIIFVPFVGDNKRKPRTDV